VLASDFDGTLATSGRVPAQTLEAVSRFRDAGGTFVLVTGRRLPELYEVFPETDAVVDLVVAENGAVLHDPASPPAVVLAAAPPVEMKDALVESGAIDVEFGEVLVSASRDDEQAVRRAARQLASVWPCQVVPNRDRVMLLPDGVDKGTGLGAAASALGVSMHRVLAIGDGENDVPMLHAAGLGVAVADAVAALREHADVLTRGEASEGVVEAIEWMLSAPVGLLVR
jgi:hydroxymethylpyrimidine pyrophosphatase-like HAD family hydrolase